MKNLLVAVIVGLLGAVHSTPIFTAALTGAENDVLQEAMIDELLIPSVTTPAPKSYPSIQASQHPSSDFKNSDVIESSGDLHARDEESGSGNFEGKSGRGMILRQEPDIISSTTVQPVDDGQEESGSGNFEGKSGRGMILRQEPDIISSTTVQPVDDGQEESGSGNLDDKLESTTAAETTTYTTGESSSTQSSHRKSGRGMIPGHDPATISSTTATMQNKVIEDEVSVRTEKGLHHGHTADVEVPRKEGSRTPGWIVVLVCIVGIAVLVIVCVAVATRERWHGPSRALQPEIKTGPEREQEIETFLHNDKPQESDNENGYTVVPLDELPQSYTSH